MSADLATLRTEPSVPPSPPRSHGAAGREAPARAALPRRGRVWTAAFLALLSAAALSLSPPPARAQVHITSSGLVGNAAVVAQRLNVGVGGDGTVHAAQPFTTPDVTGTVSISQVVLYFTDVPNSGVVDISDNNFAVVAIHASRTNPACDLDQSDDVNSFECQNAPVVPAAQGSDENDFFGDGNVPANFLFQFENPDRIVSGRNVFNAPATGITLQPNTDYHLYLTFGNVTDFTVDTIPRLNLDVGQCSSREYNSGNDNYLDVETNVAAAWTLGLAVSTTPSAGFEGGVTGSHQGKTFLVDIIGEPNHAPTGDIAGTLGIGQTLTFENLADANGLPDGPPNNDITYQWTRADVPPVPEPGEEEEEAENKEDIPGESGTTYLLDTQTKVDSLLNKQVGMDVGGYVDEHCYLNEGSVTRNFRASDQDSASLPTIEIGGEEVPPRVPVVGNTLTANIDGIDDPNGQTRAEAGEAGYAFTYRWQRETATDTWEDISGATNDAYDVGDLDANRRIRVVVVFTDDHNYPEELESLPTAAVDAPATGRPAISGVPPELPQVGVELTATLGNIADANGRTRADAGEAGYAFAYQWERVDAFGANPEDIDGATSAAYILQRDDVGHRVRVKVAFTDDAGYDEDLTSLTVPLNLEDPTDVVLAEDNQVATDLTATGTTQVGETLTADTDGIVDGNGLTEAEAGDAFTYQWRRATSDAGAGATDIGGATGATYTLVEEDQGRYVSVTVTFTDDAGREETPSSPWRGPVAAEDNVPATSPEIGCTPDPCAGVPAQPGQTAPQVGQTLEAVTSVIVDANGPASPIPEDRFTYRWSRVDADGTSNADDIPGATSKTYVLQRDDQGKRVRVTAIFEDADGNRETPTSDNTLVVEREPNEGATGLAIREEEPADGEAKVGETLTADTRDVADPQGVSGAVYTYRWERLDDPESDDSAVILLGSGETYEVRSVDHQDGESRIRLTVRFVDEAGYPETLSADPLTVEPSEGYQPPTGKPVIVDPESGEPTVVGTLEVGHTLRADVDDIDDPNGLPDRSTYRYRWERLGADGVGTPVSEGVGRDTYTLQRGDAGGTIRVRVSFRDRAGYLENLHSDPTGQVLASAAAGHEARIREWMALFGRAVSDRVLDAVGQRLHSAPRAQQGEARLAGRRIRWTPGHEDDAFARNAVEAWFGSGDPRDWLGVRTLTDEETLLRSSFSLTHGTAHGGYASVWGRGGYTSFAGQGSEVELEGGLAMGQFGVDWSFGPWMAGLSIGHSVGEGEYWDEGEGEIESALTGFYPYARYDLTDRSSVWVVTGTGDGDLKVVPESGSDEPTVETDVAFTMGAAGMRTEMLTAAEAAGGVSLALKADASVMRMDSEETEALEAVQSHANRLRLGLEAAGSRTKLEHGATLAPVVDLGVLYDGGDAGSGRGMDAGVGIAYSFPECGITADFEGRSLLAHSGPGRREWGVSGWLRYDANRSSGGRGLSMSVDGGYGGRSSTGGMDAVFDLQTVEEMGGRSGSDAALPGGRLGASLGYGLRAFEHRYTSTPKASFGLTESGSTWGLGWWLTPSKGGEAPALRGGVELEGREEEGHRIGLRLDARF